MADTQETVAQRPSDVAVETSILADTSKPSLESPDLSAPEKANHEADTVVPAGAKAETVNREPDTATATADTNGTGSSDALKTGVTADPSPSLPTPPPQDSLDTSTNQQRAMSNLTIDSPEANGDTSIAEASVTATMVGESSVAEQPNTAIPAVVGQQTSDVRDEPKAIETTDTPMEDVTVTEPATTSAQVDEGIQKAVESPAIPQNDADMPDAPAHISSPPVAATSSSLVREREDSSPEPERPNKRQRTADAETLPDAHKQSAFDAPATPSVETVKPEFSSPVAMDTSADRLIGAEREASDVPSNVGSHTGMPIHQNRAALTIIRNIKRLKDAAAFLTPVDPVKLNIPTYYDIVQQPMSLWDLERKLVALEYNTPEEVKADFAIMVENSVKFNGPDHGVSQAGKRLQENYERHMSEKMPPADMSEAQKSKKKAIPKRDPVALGTPTSKETPIPTPAPTPAVVDTPVAPTPAEVQPPTTPAPPPKIETRIRRESTRGPTTVTSAQSPTAASPTFSLTPAGLPQIRRESIAGVDGRPKRPIHPRRHPDEAYTASYARPRRKDSIAEINFCEGIHKELLKKQHYAYAYPFYDPVDPVALAIPDYFKIIKKPMDLAEVGRKLNSNEYNSMFEFEADIRLMFNNCYKFNPPGTPVYDMGKKLEQVFEQKWATKPNFKDDSLSPGPEDEDEENGEDNEASEDDQQPQLEALQAQISRLNNELNNLKNKKPSKKSSPPAQAAKGHKKRASVSNASVKESRKSTGGRKKGSGSSKKSLENGGTMSFEMKQELSERINTLSPAKMTQALALIKANHPNLAQDGDEIELDIDELAPTTLQRLYKFVSENTAAPPRSRDNAAAPKTGRGSPKPVSKSSRKKNKPMSASEQMRKITELQSQINTFEAGSPTNENGPRSLASLDQPKAAESSSDDDPSSGSESEEE